MESSTAESRRAIAMDFPASDAAESSPSLPSSPPRTIPSRLRKRLLLEPKTPSTAQAIEAKLRLADLRRQQFYENLSSKARPKPRSPSRSSSQGEDLGQRLEAKLQAAEQKRLSILDKAQKRLAKLDELRQAAKNGVELRFQRERERLGTKVELRVRQAEENRMLILKACRQRRATLKERRSQSLMCIISRENKYKEIVRAAINQKRAAAEKKRMSLLEEEKRRVHTRVLQVRRKANCVSHRREVERRRIRDQLEHRLQRAKRQRAEYLRQRGRQHNSALLSWSRNYKQADVLSRKLARCWRQFLQSKRTTLELAKDFDALNINESSVKSMPFEKLARLIESIPTLQTVKALLDRIESRLRVCMAVAAGNSPNIDNIDNLLKRVATPRKRMSPRTPPTRNREAKKGSTAREATRSSAKLSRYPVRVVLCGYMILGNPDAVFSGQGERENALTKSAEEFIQQFELLMKIILEGPVQSSDEESNSLSSKRCTFRSQLVAFDKAWCSYLNRFVTWKIKDAESLEDDLVRAACQLELSMIQKCKLTPDGESDEQLTHDMKAIQKQVSDDQKLLREKIHHLSGDAGIERMECALSEMRSKYFQAKEDGSQVFSPVTRLASSSVPNFVAGPPFCRPGDRTNLVEGVERSRHVVRSLFRENENLPVGSTSSSSIMGGGQLLSSFQNPVTENELIVNEFLHEGGSTFAKSFTATSEDQNGIRLKVKSTLEQAFWDSVMESLKQEEPNYDRVVQLVMEVRDELIDMAPKSWQQEIIDSIDVEIVSQVLKSGNLDIHFLGKILQFSLGILQKLSSPVQEDEMKVMHQKVLQDFAETCQTEDEFENINVVVLVKGLRFVLEQIQALKQEISKARIRMMEPLLRGQAGLDYLRKAFSDRYGSPLDSHNSLPLTMQWLSSVCNFIDQEWEEHTRSLSVVRNQESSSQVLVPPTTLRSGGRLQGKTSQNGHLISDAADTRQPEAECTGERSDLLLRLGLLKLVSAVSGLTLEVLPETLTLNLARLRTVQSEIQKIIVISVSILICRQALLMERAVSSSADMESILSKCTKQLLDVLDSVDNVGFEEIVNIMSQFLHDSDVVVTEEVAQSRKLIMARTLAKSLQAGDPVFEKVSRAVYLAARGVVLGGSGPIGKKLAEAALGHVGGALLADRVVEAGEVLVVAATVSLSIHGPWYVNLVGSM